MFDFRKSSLCDPFSYQRRTVRVLVDEGIIYAKSAKHSILT